MENLRRFNGRKTGHPPREETGQPEQPTEIIEREQKAWESVLGTTVEVKPLPEYVTPEVQTNLVKLGAKLFYVPALALDQDRLREISPQEYVKELAEQHPNWKPYEELSEKEKVDPKVPRNLEKWYWAQVKNGNIDFPKSPGQWMAVELRQRKDGVVSDRMYQSTKLRDYIWREGESVFELTRDMEEAKPAILSEVGLVDTLADVRFLEALEWNLLANREGWHSKERGEKLLEWTNTAWRGDRIERRAAFALYETVPYRLVVGTSYENGRRKLTGGVVDAVSPVVPATNTDYRTAIVLASGK